MAVWDTAQTGSGRLSWKPGTLPKLDGTILSADWDAASGNFIFLKTQPQTQAASQTTHSIRSLYYSAHIWTTTKMNLRLRSKQHATVRQSTSAEPPRDHIVTHQHAINACMCVHTSNSSRERVSKLLHILRFSLGLVLFSPENNLNSTLRK